MGMGVLVYDSTQNGYALKIRTPNGAFANGVLDLKSLIDGFPAGSMTASQVKTLYESNIDRNAFTDADKAKLDALVEHYKGDFADYASLPLTGLTEGDYASIAGTQIYFYIDSNWVQGGGGGGGASSTILVNKPSHGLVVGDWVTGAFEKGNGTDYTFSEVVGMVSIVTDPDNFVLVTAGEVIGTFAGVAGDTIYLSNTGETSTSSGYILKELGNRTPTGMIIDIKISYLSSDALLPVAVSNTDTTNGYLREKLKAGDYITLSTAIDPLVGQQLVITGNDSGVIHTLLEETTPSSSDLFVFSDISAGNQRKKITFSNLVAGLGGFIGSKELDESQLAEGRVLTFSTTDNKVVYRDPATNKILDKLVDGSNIADNRVLAYNQANDQLQYVDFPTGSAITNTSDLVNDGEDGTSPYATLEDIASAGGGDMLISVYGGSASGIVKDSDRLGNQLPAYYLDYTNATNKPIIPTLVSQLTNDSGYLTAELGLVGNKEVDEADIANGKVLTYNSVSDKVEYQTPTSGVTDHTLLTNIGTNTHAQIDTHISDSSLHYPMASISITESQISDLQAYELSINKGIANGYASLDATGKIPSAQLPSYVDDVEEYADLASLPVSGEQGKIYITLDDNKIYRWSGTVYVEISASSGSPIWGSITGTLSNQTDLQTALDLKSNTDHLHTGIYEPIDASILRAVDIGVTIQAYNADYVIDNAYVHTDNNYTTAEQTKVGFLTVTSATDLDTIRTNSHTALTLGTKTVDESAIANGYVLSYNDTSGNLEYVLQSSGVTDHTLLTNIGTNTHAQIDTHIADTDIHYPMASISITESQISDLQAYELLSNKGVANGYASLDGSGLLPIAQLPAIASDIEEYADLASFPASGASGKLYLALDTNILYRWDGVAYVAVSASSTGTVWGDITGTLANQTDLQTALDLKADKANVLELDNTTSFTPTLDYHPATKKYVDDQINANAFNELYIGGSADTDGTWRFVTDVNGKLLIEKRVAGTWVSASGIVSSDSTQSALDAGANSETIDMYIGGSPSSDGTWKLYVNGSGELTMAKRIAGTYVDVTSISEI